MCIKPVNFEYVRTPRTRPSLLAVGTPGQNNAICNNNGMGDNRKVPRTIPGRHTEPKTQQTGVPGQTFAAAMPGHVNIHIATNLDHKPSGRVAGL